MKILIVCIAGAIPLFVNGMRSAHTTSQNLVVIFGTGDPWGGLCFRYFPASNGEMVFQPWPLRFKAIYESAHRRTHARYNSGRLGLEQRFEMIGHCHAEFWKWNAEEMSCKKMPGPGRRPLRGMSLEPTGPEGDWCMVTVVFVEFVLVTIFTSAQAEIPSDNDQSRTLYTVNQADMLTYLRPNTNIHCYIVHSSCKQFLGR